MNSQWNELASVCLCVFPQGTSDPSAAREQDAEAGPGRLGQREDRSAAESPGGRQPQEERAGDREQVGIQRTHTASTHAAAEPRVPLMFEAIHNKMLLNQINWFCCIVCAKSIRTSY